MVYTFQTIHAQNSLGPGPSSVMFFKNKTNHKTTPNPIIWHILMNQYIEGHTWKANEYSVKILPWDFP